MPRCAARAAAAAGAPLALISRHLIAALVATAVDFTAMVGLVELAAVPAALAALAGGLLGGLTNFALGRRWVYRATAGAPAPQAALYAVVSAMSACLNALGEQLLLTYSDAHYAAARVAVALTISVLWNYPMQRYVVFASPRRGAPGACGSAAIDHFTGSNGGST
jgi:putative flippase GtrA